MPDPDFDPFDFLAFLRRRWKIPAAASALAVALAAAVCFLLPNLYTATATLVVEPPGIDPRAAISLSPVYLESLKSYETFAASDSLFAKAAEKFQLDRSRASLESLKDRVLRVEKLKDTKLLQISVTLPDPRKAQAVVQYLAEETVALDNRIARSGDRELLADAERQLDAARRRMEQARTALEALAPAGAESAFESEIQSLASAKGRLEEQRVDAASLVAENVARGEESSIQQARARVSVLEEGLAALQKNLDAKSAALAAYRERRRRANDDLVNAQETFNTAQKREYDVYNVVTFRTGQLRVVDPGIVPQKPSFPNLPLAVLSAAILSAGACLIWLTAQFGLATRKRHSLPAGLRMAGSGAR
ncbi:MAG TPA: Wzz/FepE/Etk N-terminal domain-containing protein [Bryobacteraceae bacterium]|nr:Wzz/FepE/Etk N-terminal domain-containing protein [Bryobacteraceae bacterium]